MKKVIIRSKDGTERAGAEMLDPTEWITQCVDQNVWGKPERWVLEKSDPMAQEQYDDADVLETEARESESGLKTWVKLRADYTVEILDVTYEAALQDCISKRVRAYPSPEEFLNAYFDGGEVALDILKQKRFEVKAKYPKPVRES